MLLCRLGADDLVRCHDRQRADRRPRVEEGRHRVNADRPDDGDEHVGGARDIPPLLHPQHPRDLAHLGRRRDRLGDQPVVEATVDGRHTTIARVADLVQSAFGQAIPVPAQGQVGGIGVRRRDGAADAGAATSAAAADGLRQDAVGVVARRGDPGVGGDGDGFRMDDR